MLAREPGAGRRGHRRDGKRDPVIGVRRELKLGVEQFVGRGLGGDGLARQQANEDVQVGFQQLARVGWGQPDHRRVGGQRARSDATDDAAVGEVIEQHQPVGRPQRVVVRQRDDTCPEPDPLGPFGRRGDEHLR